MKRIFTILFLIIVLSPSYGQIRLFNRYYPADNTDTIKKYQVSASFSEGSNSNSFTNEFYSSFNKSEFINDDLKNRQIGNLKSPVLTGDIRNIGIQNAIAKLDDLMDHVGRSHATVGAQSNSLTASLERTQTLEISTMTLRSSTIDTDMAESSLKLTQLSLNYEAMLSTVGRISKLSLVNYL